MSAKCLIWSTKEIRLSSSNPLWYHFAGVAGSGMSALAQFHVQSGGRATGSDRSFDNGERPEVRAQLERLGVVIVPQDGTYRGALPGHTCDAMVVSTAVEETVPDVQAARAGDIPLVHRSELLARYVRDHRTVAVTGTSGKSTVTAMIFTLLQAAGLEPGLLTGGPLTALVADGHLGNAWAGTPQAGQPSWLVIEADESDGSVVRYHPWAGVVLNLGLDHKAPADVLAMFHTFHDNTTGPFIRAHAANLDSLGPNDVTFGAEEGRVAATDIQLLPDGSIFRIDDQAYRLPVPGLYNVLNATAAVAVGLEIGLSPAGMAAALAGFRGVSRRFNSVGQSRGVEVIDDFAHNPDKIAAALAAGRQRLAHGSGRLLAIFQPHGFGPTRFLRDALIETFCLELGERDTLWLPEIFYAGGTASRDISARELVEGIREGGRDARFCATRADLPDAVAAEARRGDLVLVMGARDPSLTAFCRDILTALEGVGETPGQAV